MGRSPGARGAEHRPRICWGPKDPHEGSYWGHVAPNLVPSLDGRRGLIGHVLLAEWGWFGGQVSAEVARNRVPACSQESLMLHRPEGRTAHPSVPGCGPHIPAAGQELHPAAVLPAPSGWPASSGPGCAHVGGYPCALLTRGSASVLWAHVLPLWACSASLSSRAPSRAVPHSTQQLLNWPGHPPTSGTHSYMPELWESRLGLLSSPRCPLLCSGLAPAQLTMRGDRSPGSGKGEW